MKRASLWLHISREVPGLSWTADSPFGVFNLQHLTHFTALTWTHHLHTATCASAVRFTSSRPRPDGLVVPVSRLSLKQPEKGALLSYITGSNLHMPSKNSHFVQSVLAPFFFNHFQIYSCISEGEVSDWFFHCFHPFHAIFWNSMELSWHWKQTLTLSEPLWNQQI